MNTSTDILTISNLISSFEIVNKYSNDHFIFKCKIIDLVKGPFINWEFNRPPEVNRSYEIAKYAYNVNKKLSDLDWVLYTFYCNEEKIIKIYDGIHRFVALSIIYKENKNPIDLLSNNIFGSNCDASWLYNKYILISIRLNATFGEISDLFQSLNKSHPVPDLYISNKDSDKRQIIEEVSNEWVKKFKSHFSTNSKPNIPNINVDLFVELLDKIYKKYKINKINSHLLNELLYQMNDSIKNRLPKKATPSSIKKCKETGCYLFLYKKDVLEDMF